MADGKVVIDIEADDSGFEKELDDVADSAEDAGGSLDDLGDSAKKAGDGFDVANIAAGNFIADGITALVSAVGDAIASLVSLSDETREYREDMAKLETAFTTAGHSTETAQQAYDDFYKILGESDRSVEAVNHLAELTQSEEELAKWSDIAAGVTAKFGDSLPIEGLTEAANESAKVGSVVGPLADAINWATLSNEQWNEALGEGTPQQKAFAEAIKKGESAEDAFNAALAACTTEQERATLITSTLNTAYESAAAEYNELTASTQAARDATNQMEQAQADIGAALEPVTTAWTNLKANALEAITPVIQTVAEKIQELSAWMRDHETAATIIKGVLIGVAAALAVLVAVFGGMMIVQTVTAAFAAFNLTLLANPIVLIVAAIAALVAAFIYLWNNCESFRNFWIGLWEGIKTAAGAVADWFTETWETVTTWFSEKIAEFSTWFSDAWAAIQEVFSGTTIAAYFQAIWDSIKLIFSVVKDVFTGNWSGAWEGIKGIVSTWAGYYATVWENIKAVFAVVGSWFSGIFSDAWAGITGVWDSVTGYFTDLYNNIVGAFDGIVDDFFSVGDNIISGIWSGLSAGWDWLTGKVSSLASGLFTAAKNVLGIASPSKKFKWIGEMSGEGVGVGFEDSMSDVEADINTRMKDMTARVQATVSAENARVGYSTARDNGFSEVAQAVGMQSAGINSLAAEYRRGSSNKRPIVLQLDKRELGRAFVDVGAVETARLGVSYS